MRGATVTAATLLGLFTALTGCAVEPDPTEEQLLQRYERRLQQDHDRAVSDLGWSRWTYLGTGCADGWDSASVGEQGACSWHGGVVSWWRNDAGELLWCHEGQRPMTVEQAADAQRRGDPLTCR